MVDMARRKVVVKCLRKEKLCAHVVLNFSREAQTKSVVINARPSIIKRLCVKVMPRERNVWLLSPKKKRSLWEEEGLSLFQSMSS